VVAGLLFVPLAALAIIGAGMMRSTTPAASGWDSKQPWTGPLATATERDLVAAAAQVAERIARNPGRRTGTPGEQQLDVAAELDQIDEQAYRIAVAKQQTGASDPILDQAWQALVDRVAALDAYADGDWFG
jgi:hypothetical protein